MSISLAAVHTPPSYGLAHVPEVAEQAELVTTFVPSRFKTYSLDDTFSTNPRQIQKQTYRVLQDPSMVFHVGNRSLS